MLILNSITNHLQEHWEIHIPSVGGAGVSLANTGFSLMGVMQAVLVGYILFLLTSLTKFAFKRLFK